MFRPPTRVPRYDRWQKTGLRQGPAVQGTARVVTAIVSSDIPPETMPALRNAEQQVGTVNMALLWSAQRRQSHWQLIRVRTLLGLVGEARANRCSCRQAAWCSNRIRRVLSLALLGSCPRVGAVAVTACHHAASVRGQSVWREPRCPLHPPRPPATLSLPGTAGQRSGPTRDPRRGASLPGCWKGGWCGGADVPAQSRPTARCRRGDAASCAPSTATVGRPPEAQGKRSRDAGTGWQTAATTTATTASTEKK